MSGCASTYKYFHQIWSMNDPCWSHDHESESNADIITDQNVLDVFLSE